MLADNIYNWSQDYPLLVVPALFIFAFIAYRLTKFTIARLSYRIALRTSTIYDDLFVDRLQPFRFAWLLPLLLIFFYADQFLAEAAFIKNLSIILSSWF